jgi:hypothetical protein
MNKYILPAVLAFSSAAAQAAPCRDTLQPPPANGKMTQGVVLGNLYLSQGDWLIAVEKGEPKVTPVTRCAAPPALANIASQRMIAAALDYCAGEAQAVKLDPIFGNTSPTSEQRQTFCKANFRRHLSAAAAAPSVAAAAQAPSMPNNAALDRVLSGFYPVIYSTPTPESAP